MAVGHAEFKINIVGKDTRGDNHSKNNDISGGDSTATQHQGGGKLLHIKTGLLLCPFESFYNFFIRFAVILIRYRITDS